jgi:hypothetical protein
MQGQNGLLFIGTDGNGITIYDLKKFETHQLVRNFQEANNATILSQFIPFRIKKDLFDLELMVMEWIQVKIGVQELNLNCPNTRNTLRILRTENQQ